MFMQPTPFPLPDWVWQHWNYITMRKQSIAKAAHLCYNNNRQKMRVSIGHAKAPVFQHRGFSYSTRHFFLAAHKPDRSRLYLILAVLCAILISAKKEIVVKRPTKQKPRSGTSGVFILASCHCRSRLTICRCSSWLRPPQRKPRMILSGSIDPPPFPLPDWVWQHWNYITEFKQSILSVQRIPQPQTGYTWFRPGYVL